MRRSSKSSITMSGKQDSSSTVSRLIAKINLSRHPLKIADGGIGPLSVNIHSAKPPLILCRPRMMNIRSTLWTLMEKARRGPIAAAPNVTAANLVSVNMEDELVETKADWNDRTAT